jgi:hypothetical protein
MWRWEVFGRIGAKIFLQELTSKFLETDIIVLICGVQASLVRDIIRDFTILVCSLNGVLKSRIHHIQSSPRP